MNALRSAFARSALYATVWTAVSAQRAFCFPADFCGFEGHFPGDPLLPAVVQVALGMFVLEECCAEPCTLRTVRHAKFLHPVRPGQEILVQGTPADVSWRSAGFVLTVAGQAVSRFTLETRPGEW